MKNILGELLEKINYSRKTQGIFLAYFIIVNLFAAGMVGSLLYFRSSDALEEETIKSEQNILLGLKVSTEIMMGQVEDFIGQASTEPNIMDVMKYYDSNNVSEMDKINNNLNRMKLLNDYIYNFSVYYTNQKRVFEINNGIYKLEDYPYKELISSVCKFPVSLKKAPLSKISDTINGNRTVNVVSIVKPIPMNGSLPDAYAVANIEERYFKSIMNSMIEREGMEIYITNKEGEIITSNSQARKYSELINNDYLNTFDSKNSDYRVDKVNEEKVLISIVTSKDYEWKYVSIIPYNTVVSKVQFIKKYSLVVFFLAVIMGLILSLLLSKRISSPIKSIAELLKNNGSNGDDRNIFEYIERNINTLVEKNVSFEKHISDHMPVLRNNFITNILMGNVPGPEEIRNRLNYYGVNLNFNSLHIVCIIPLDNYRKLSSKYSEQQMNMLVIYLMETLNQFVNKGNKGLVVNTKPDEIAILLELPSDEDKNAVKSMVEALGAEMQKTILNNTKHTAAVGIGSICTDLSRISDSYDEALYALNYRILMGNSSIIFYDDIKDIQEENFSYPFKIEKELLEALSKGDRTVALEKSTDIFKYFINSSSEVGDISYYYMQLLNAIIKCSFELGINVESICNKNNLYSEILKCKNILEVQEFFEEVFINICMQVESRRNTKTHNSVTELEKYIKENYEKDLSLAALAEQVFMSVAYMRKLFKEQTGKSIKQYINEVRLEKSKELLISSQIKISEVAEMVGYDKVHAFIYFFKENTGMTPGEYRVKAGVESNPLE